MDVDEELGRVLRSIRKQRQVSQETLALDAGADRNYVSLIELGKNSPSVRMLFRLCAAMDVEPSLVLSEVQLRLAANASVPPIEEAP